MSNAERFNKIIDELRDVAKLDIHGMRGTLLGALQEAFELGAGGARVVDIPAEHGHTFCPHCLPCRKHEKLIAYEDAMWALASYVGNGPGSGEATNPADMEARIREGIDTITRVEKERASNERFQTFAGGRASGNASPLPQTLIGVDEGKPGGDKTVKVSGHRDAQGVMHITDVEEVEPVVPCPDAGRFTCPRCGSHYFGTSQTDFNDWSCAVGHCHGYVGRQRCTFQWNREADDAKVFGSALESPAPKMPRSDIAARVKEAEAEFLLAAGSSFPVDMKAERDRKVEELRSKLIALQAELASEPKEPGL